MKKSLLALAIACFGLNAQAATCEVLTSTNNYKKLNRTQVEARFDEKTTVEVQPNLTLSFTLAEERTSPDTFVQYITVDGADESLCRSSNLFNEKNIYNGVAVACSQNALAPFDMFSIACRF